MFQDPNRIRSKKATVFIDQYETDVITALANYRDALKAEARC